MSKQPRPRNIANDMLDAVETATRKWTRQRKAEERHPGMVRYRASRMTREPRTTQKDAAWEIMGVSYMAASTNNTLPAKARQIFYQARPKIMALTDDKELAYGYFSQTLLPDYIEEHDVKWNVVYDARGHLEEPHTNRRIGIGTIEIDNYLRAMRVPKVVAAEFADAKVSVIGPSGNIAGVLFCEKEGFDPLFKAVDLANRHDLMIISTKGTSVVAARKLVVRLEDIAGLEREPAAATKVNEADLRIQLANNGATPAEIEILLNERVELNAMTSGDLIAMIERKLKAYGLKKVIPDADLLGETYLAFHRSKELREAFEELESEFEETEIKVPKNLAKRVRAILDRQADLRWDDAIQIVLDGTQLDAVRKKKRKAKEEAGNFTDTDDAAEEDEGGDE